MRDSCGLRFLLVLAFGLALAPARAEPQLVRFGRYGLDDGLSQSSAYTIAQDADGFLWVGGQNGLNRFDGTTFRAAWGEEGTPSPVSYSYVRSVFVDSNDNLWVGLEDRGLFLYDPRRETFDSVPAVSPGGEPVEHPARFYQLAESGDRVLAATDRGLATIEWDSAGPMLVVGPRSASCDSAVTALWATGDTLWTGSPSGCLIVRYGGIGSPRRQVLELRSPITDIGEGPGGTVLVATSGRGVVSTDRAVRLLTELPPPSSSERSVATSVLTTRDQDIWFGTRGGLGWIRAGSADTTWFVDGAAAAGALPHQQIETIFEDRSGVLWIGTWSGLARLTPYYGGIQYLPVPVDPNGRPVGGVLSMLADGPDGLLVGTLGGALARLQRTAETPGAIEYSLAPSSMYSLARDLRGDLWVATNGSGVHRLTPDGWKDYRADPHAARTIAQDYVVAMLVDSHGVVWAGTTKQGLVVYDTVNDRFDRFDLSGPPADGGETYIWPIREATDGTLWFGLDGADGGLYRLSPERQSLRFYPTSDPERPDAGRVLTLTPSGDTLVWFGTQGSGIGQLDRRTGEIRFLTVRDGLPHNSVGGIMEDGTGKVWIGTNGGLARLDPASGQFWVFTEASGIQSRRFLANSTWSSENGLLYFGGENGITVVDPSRLDPPDEPPPVALVRFLVRGVARTGVTNRSTASVIELEPDENFFTIEFAALDFREFGANQLRYRLENLEENWIDAGPARSARYTGVPPGRYRFIVQSRNVAGPWNEEALVVGLFVHPPYYRTPLFRGLLLAALTGLLYAAYRYRKNQLDRVKALRISIAGELHDDIGANLSAIALKSDLVGRVASESIRRQSLADIHRLAHDTMQQVREMIWVVREEYDSVHGLLSRMEDAAQTLLGSVVSYEFAVTDPLPDGALEMEFRQLAYGVFKEALQNTLKHASASHVRITVRHQPPTLHLTIVDDGCGFDIDSVRVGTGLKLIRERSQKPGVHAAVSSTPGGGTRVELTVRTR